jgi:DNA sulfur modification protein DndB
MVDFYPALRSKMGSWDYFIARMTMKKVADNVKFASEIHEEPTLDDAIQRTLDESRVKKEIVKFLQRRPDRFFGSLVVAATGGEPSFTPVNIDSSGESLEAQLASTEEFHNAYGLLGFGERAKFYALDGQHRLKAIKALMSDTDDNGDIVQRPEGFENEHVSVLIVIRKEAIAEETWVQAYRRLFSSLNRYAKPTDADTNIIMDEDDAVAICTRRLIGLHPFFQATGTEKDSFRVQTKGKPLREGSPHFTSLQELYGMNLSLLSTHARENLGWSGQDVDQEDFAKTFKAFKTFRPSDEHLDALYDELVQYWDLILEAIPELHDHPSDRKNHNDPNGDHLLFWPIGQEVLINVARSLLSKATDNENNLNQDAAREALSPLSKIDWLILHSPWKGIMIQWHEDSGKWRMPTDRKLAMTRAELLIRWIIGLDTKDEQETEKFKIAWRSELRLPEEENTTEHVEKMWSAILDVQKQILLGRS